MALVTPIDLRGWVKENRHLLKPPVGNKCIWQDENFIIMVVGGPNSRKDYHFDESEEFFYQLEGDMVLKTMQVGQPVDIPIREGEIFLLPARMPHSPQRFANTIGLVIERQRHREEKDGFMWFCEKCNHKLYEEYLHVSNIETQLTPVFDRFWSNEKNRTCDQCGTVMQKP